MLKRYTLIILFLFSTVLQLSYGGSHKHKKAMEFDLLIFAQQWPVSFCMEQNDMMVPYHNCVLPNQLEWTIHGIWPARFHVSGPSFCNKTLYFNESLLYPILPQLEVKWKDHLVGHPRYSFWKHEWDSHGTCAIDMPELNTQLKYFEKALDLQNEYDMNRVLAKAGILPGQDYALQDIINRIEKILGKTVQIKCLKIAKTQQLMDIRICLDKSFKPIDCNEIFAFLDKCDHSMPVNYPGTIPISRSNEFKSV